MSAVIKVSATMSIVACGTPEELAKHKKSYTGEYLKQVLK